jgi:hypothetical protein
LNNKFTTLNYLEQVALFYRIANYISKWHFDITFLSQDFIELVLSGYKPTGSRTLSNLLPRHVSLLVHNELADGSAIISGPDRR